MDAGRVLRRPRLLVAVAAPLALVFGGLWLWQQWLPGYRPALRPGERYGVDVSAHQGAIDWRRVAGDGIAFAYLKATEGGDFVDGAFRRNWEGAGAAGLKRGAYHFFTLCRPGADQAENFLRTVPPDRDALPPVVDLEFGGNCSRRPERAWILRELRAFLSKVESARGRRMVVYVLDDVEKRYGGLRAELARPVWQRRILLRPEGRGWWIWQVGGYASVRGIKTEADLDVMRGSDPVDPPPHESRGDEMSATAKDEIRRTPWHR